MVLNKAHPSSTEHCAAVWYASVHVILNGFSLCAIECTWCEGQCSTELNAVFISFRSGKNIQNQCRHFFLFLFPSLLPWCLQ